MHLSIGTFFYIIGFEIEAKSMHYTLKYLLWKTIYTSLPDKTAQSSVIGNAEDFISSEMLCLLDFTCLETT